MADKSLEFEKPLVEIEKKIQELKDLAGEGAMDAAEEIAALEKKVHF